VTAVGGFDRRSAMTEGSYRAGKFVLLVLLVVGVIGLGWRASEIYREANQAAAEAARHGAENGRYQQVDFNKLASGLSAGTYVVDTRDGTIIEAKIPGNQP
jgi:hypothetical protein